MVAARPSNEDLRAFEGTYQINEKSVRTLFIRDNKLYSQRDKRSPIPLQLSADERLHFIPDELSYLMLVRDAAGRITRLDCFEDGDGPPRPLPRIQ